MPYISMVLTMILKQLSFSNKLGNTIVTVTNNVLTHIFEDFPSCELFTLLHNHWLLLLFVWNTLTVSQTVLITIPLRRDPIRVDVAGLQGMQ